MDFQFHFLFYLARELAPLVGASMVMNRTPETRFTTLVYELYPDVTPSLFMLWGEIDYIRTSHGFDGTMTPEYKRSANELSAVLNKMGYNVPPNEVYVLNDRARMFDFSDALIQDIEKKKSEIEDAVFNEYIQNLLLHF